MPLGHPLGARLAQQHVDPFEACLRPSVGLDPDRCVKCRQALAVRLDSGGGWGIVWGRHSMVG